MKYFLSFVSCFVSSLVYDMYSYHYMFVFVYIKPNNTIFFSISLSLSFKKKNKILNTLCVRFTRIRKNVCYLPLIKMRDICECAQNATQQLKIYLYKPKIYQTKYRQKIPTKYIKFIYLKYIYIYVLRTAHNMESTYI